MRWASRAGRCRERVVLVNGGRRGPVDCWRRGRGGRGRRGRARRPSRGPEYGGGAAGEPQEGLGLMGEVEVLEDEGVVDVDGDHAAREGAEVVAERRGIGLEVAGEGPARRATGWPRRPAWRGTAASGGGSGRGARSAATRAAAVVGVARTSTGVTRAMTEVGRRGGGRRGERRPRQRGSRRGRGRRERARGRASAPAARRRSARSAAISGRTTARARVLSAARRSRHCASRRGIVNEGRGCVETGGRTRTTRSASGRRGGRPDRPRG